MLSCKHWQFQARFKARRVKGIRHKSLFDDFRWRRISCFPLLWYAPCPHPTWIHTVRPKAVSRGCSPSSGHLSVPQAPRYLRTPAPSNHSGFTHSWLPLGVYGVVLFPAPSHTQAAAQGSLGPCTCRTRAPLVWQGRGWGSGCRPGTCCGQEKAQPTHCLSLWYHLYPNQPPEASVIPVLYILKDFTN